MIGVLIVVGIVFYAVMYSGLKTLGGEPTGIGEALTGRGLITAEKKVQPGASAKAIKAGKAAHAAGVPKRR